jgi:hypothetical protein
MQRIGRVAGGVKAYQNDARCLLRAEMRRCPLCPDRHRLRLHGSYERCVLLAGEEPTLRIRVQRLLCRASGRTVSLLPDFCLPRRQYAVGVLGRLLQGAVVQRLGLWRALVAARREVPGHSVAQALVRGFRERLPALRAYLAGHRPRVPDPPAGLRGWRREIAPVVIGLLAQATEAEQAFVHHGVLFHAQFGLGMA